MIDRTTSTISVVIPTYNEARAIGQVVREVPRNRVQEVIVVDNGSTDGTAERAAAAGARVILAEMRIPPNYGATYAERFHAIYGELAAEYGATLLPFLLEEIALEPGMMMDDGIHPTVAAQPLILDAVWVVLEPLLD